MGIGWPSYRIIVEGQGVLLPTLLWIKDNNHQEALTKMTVENIEKM